MTDLVMGNAARSARYLGLFRRVAGVIAVGVGLVALIVGIMIMASQGWTHATGKVQSCSARLTNGGPGRHVEQDCVVTWSDGTTQRLGRVVVTGAVAFPGQSLQLRVHGNDVALPTPAWEGYGSVGVGVALIAGGAVAALRTRRA